MKRWMPLASAYAISTDGDIWSFRSRSLMAAHPHNGGYRRVSLTLANGRRVWRKVHALVLEAFVGPRPTPRHHGAHEDRDRTNNRLTNLRWALPVENEADKRRHGTHRNGQGRRDVSPAVVTAIRAEAACGASFSAIGRALGMHRSSVSRIVRGLRHGGRGLASGARPRGPVDVPGGGDGRTPGRAQGTRPGGGTSRDGGRDVSRGETGPESILGGRQGSPGEARP